jgi:hypothetical protein
MITAYTDMADIYDPGRPPSAHPWVYAKNFRHRHPRPDGGSVDSAKVVEASYGFLDL